MKRLFACLAFAALPLSAQASGDLARQWGQEASRLSEQTSEMIFAVDRGQPLEISETYTLDVYRFGRTSADLARWIDSANGPNDLSCLFRGMAAESEDQLMALESPEGQQTRTESLNRLASLFSDAELVAVAAQRRASIKQMKANQETSQCAVDRW